MRLLVVYQHAPTPDAPGIYRHRRLLEALASRGWTIDVVASPINYMTGAAPPEYAARRYTREKIGAVTHHWVRATDQQHRSMRRRARNYLTFALGATLRGWRLPRPDVVWASSPPLTVGSAGAWIARRHRCPWVFEVRDLWPESAAAAGLLEPSGRTYRLLERAAHRYARSADGAIVPTPGLVDDVRRHGAADVTLVTGALDEQPPDPLEREQVRAELGIGASDCVFAYVGAHGIVNDLGVLLDAAEQLASREGPTVHVLMAGGGSAFEALASRLAAQPIPGVHLLGTVARARARSLLAAADVGLHLLRPDPTFDAALPTKVLEYLGCHLPFITTAGGLSAEVALASGGARAHDAASLATTMGTWADMDAGERRRRGSGAASWARERYGLEATVDALEDALRRAITRGQAAKHP